MEFLLRENAAMFLLGLEIEHRIFAQTTITRKKMIITITDRWGNEIEAPDKTLIDKTIDDVFLDNALPEVSMTDGDFHLDINKNGWVYLSDDDGHEYYMKNIEEEKIRQLWGYFHEGKIAYILAEPWIEGIPSFNGDW